MAELGTSQGFNLVLQVGLQSAFGTPVAATDIIPASRASFGARRPTEFVPGPTGSIGIPNIKRRLGLRSVGGSFSSPIRLSQMDLFGQMIFPHNASTAYAFANAGAAVVPRLWTFEHNDENFQKSEFSDCRVNAIRIGSSDTELDLMANVDVIGAIFDDDITMTGALTHPTAAALQHTDLAFTINPSGTPVPLNPQSVELAVMNNLAPIYRNSLDALAIPGGNRVVTVTATFDKNSTTKTQFDKWLAQTASAIRLKWTYAVGDYMQFDLPLCYLQGDWPESVADNAVETLTLTWQAFASAFGANDEMTGTIAIS